MTQHELEAVGKAIGKALAIGAPGVSDVTRQAIIQHAVLQLRHQFDVPRPKP